MAWDEDIQVIKSSVSEVLGARLVTLIEFGESIMKIIPELEGRIKENSSLRDISRKGFVNSRKNHNVRSIL